MNSLLEKLQGLPARREITGLIDALSATDRLLQPLVVMWEPTVQAKNWMRQVREMVYDIEDWVDDLIHRLHRDSDKEGSAIKGLVRKLPKKMGSSDIQLFSARVKAANERHNRYQLGSTSSGADADSIPANATGSSSAASASNPADATGSSSAAMASNPASSSVLEMRSLVGVDGPRDELLHLLGGEAKQVKVISMVGSAGLGKTTLATQVYGKLRRRFKCEAFVYAGRTPSVRKVLKGIFSQVNRKPPSGFVSWDEQKLILELRKFLQNKK
jgi:hypothetical protein